MNLAAYCFAIAGWRHVFVALGWFDVRAPSCFTCMCPSYLHSLQTPWSYHVPAITFLLVYILAVVLGFAVTVMAGWHVWGIACGETSVEAQDHEHYRKVAKKRGEVWFGINSSIPRTDESPIGIREFL